MSPIVKNRITWIFLGLILTAGCGQQPSQTSQPSSPPPKPSLIPLAGVDSSTCTAALFEALKTRYTSVKGSTTAEVTMELACSAENQSLGVNYGAFGLDAAQVKKACAQKDKKFFETKFANVAFSFLPPDAFKFLGTLCSASGLRLNVEGSSGNQVTIEAIWTTPKFTSVASTKIRSTPTVTGPAICQFQSLTGGITLKHEQPKSDICQRTGDGQVSVVLRTENGDAFASATRPPPKATYVLNMLGADDAASCVVNGTHVASIKIFESALGINLNPHLKEGENTVTCTVQDLKQGANFHPQWSYAFELLENGVKIWSPSFGCNDTSPRCEAKGETISTTFVFR